MTKITAKNNKGHIYELDASLISHAGGILPFHAPKSFNDFWRATGFIGGSAEQIKTHKVVWQAHVNTWSTISSIADSQDRKDKENQKLRAKERKDGGYNCSQSYVLPKKVDGYDGLRVTVQLANARAAAQARKDAYDAQVAADAAAKLDVEQARSQNRGISSAKETVAQRTALKATVKAQNNGASKVSPTAAKLAADAAKAIASLKTSPEVAMK